MMLVIGGNASGKLNYVKSLGYGDDDISDGEITDRPVVYNLQKIVFDDYERAPELFEMLKEKAVVVCDEVGSGIIPADKTERLSREAAGRLCVQLANSADRVVRCVAGIPINIK